MAKPDDWEATIALFLTRQMSERTFLNPSNRQRQRRCRQAVREAYFYAGSMRLIQRR